MKVYYKLLVILSWYRVTDRIFRQNRNGSFQLILGRQALWQKQSPGEQEKRCGNLAVEMKIEPLTELELETLLRHAKRSHATSTACVLELPDGQRVNTFLLYQLSNKHIVSALLHCTSNIMHTKSVKHHYTELAKRADKMLIVSGQMNSSSLKTSRVTNTVKM